MSKVISQLIRQLVFQVCYTEYQALFYVWQIGLELKYCKVPKCYVQGCSFLSSSFDSIEPAVNVFCYITKSFF